MTEAYKFDSTSFPAVLEWKEVHTHTTHPHISKATSLGRHLHRTLLSSLYTKHIVLPTYVFSHQVPDLDSRTTGCRPRHQLLFATRQPTQTPSAHHVSGDCHTVQVRTRLIGVPRRRDALRSVQEHDGQGQREQPARPSLSQLRDCRRQEGLVLSGVPGRGSWTVGWLPTGSLESPKLTSGASQRPPPSPFDSTRARGRHRKL